MPAQKSKNASVMTELEFINWELTAEEKKAAKLWDVTPEYIFGALEALVSDGYKVAIKYDNYNKCTSFSVTEPVRKDGKPSRCIVSRGPDVTGAARIACYKHFELLAGDWGNISAKSVERDVWG